MKKFNLKLTNKQMYLVQSYIYDLANHNLYNKYSESELKEFDDSDFFRIKICNKETKLNKSYYIFNDLTENEIHFIKDEIHYFVFDGFERDNKEKQIATRIINNINNILTLQYQRNLILEDLLK